MHDNPSDVDVRYLCQRFCFALAYDAETNMFQYKVTKADTLDALSLHGKQPFVVLNADAIIQQVHVSA